jgi:hypothetical protein
MVQCRNSAPIASTVRAVGRTRGAGARAGPVGLLNQLPHAANASGKRPTEAQLAEIGYHIRNIRAEVMRALGRLGRGDQGQRRGGPVELTKHLKRADTNERVEILGLRGVAVLDLDGALREMYAMGAALRTTRTLCHASINVPAHERLTPEQRAKRSNGWRLRPG